MATVTRYRLALVVSAALSSIACAEELPEPEPGEPICMIVNSLGHWNDGRQRVIQHLGTSYAGHPVGCACLPPDDRWSWDDETVETLAEIAVEDCERIADTYFDFDWDDCRADYEARAWEDLQWSMIYVGPGGWEEYHPPDLRCEAP